MCMHAGVQIEVRGQTTVKRQFSPSTLRSQGSNPRLGSMCLYPLSHLAGLVLYELAALKRPGILSILMAVVRGLG